MTEFSFCVEAIAFTRTNLGVGPFMFSGNEARPHLADIITLERQEEAVLVQGVIMSLAKAVRHEGFTQTQ